MEIYIKYLQKYLKPSRLGHCRRVSETAVRLAESLGMPAEKPRLAGLLHDAARDLSPRQMLKKLNEYSLQANPVELKEPLLLHGKIGAAMVARELGIRDKEILQAITRHTIAGPEMTLLDKIIFVADFLEPGREIPDLEWIRDIVMNDFKRGYFHVLQAILQYVIRKGFYFHPDTIAAWNETIDTLHTEGLYGNC